MPLNLGNMRSKTATVDVGRELGDKDFEGLYVTYRPFVSTTAEQRKVAEFAEQDAYVELVDYGVDSALAQIISWDLEEDGVTVPLTKEALSALPDGILAAVGNAIRSHKSPNLKKGKR